MKSEIIQIKRLRISTHIGVPDEERENAQQLCVSVNMWPEMAFDELNDEIGGGVDYYQVSLRLKDVAAARPRKLIETLASDLAEMIVKEFAVKEVELSIEKYILDDADFEFAHRVSEQFPELALYLQPVSLQTQDSRHTEQQQYQQQSQQLKWLLNKMIAKQWYHATLLPQLHTLLWGKQRGV